jgi:uncharacterized protein YggE
MSFRKHLGQTLALAALTLGAAAVAPLDASAATVEPPNRQQIIIAHGTGNVHVRPDSLRVDIGVESEAATLDQARTEVNEGVHKVVEAVRALNIPEIKIETRVLRFNPVYAPQKDLKPPQIVGYGASNHVVVTTLAAPLGELGDRAAHIVDAALGAGANSIGGLDFFLKDPSEAQAAAIRAAVQAAEQDAQSMAAASSVTLAGLAGMEESGPRYVPRALSIELADLGAAPPATPVEVGDVTIQSSVTARYYFR